MTVRKVSPQGERRRDVHQSAANSCEWKKAAIQANAPLRVKLPPNPLSVTMAMENSVGYNSQYTDIWLVRAILQTDVCFSFKNNAMSLHMLIEFTSIAVKEEATAESQTQQRCSHLEAPKNGCYATPAVSPQQRVLSDTC